jgi:hypothetical protein
MSDVNSGAVHSWRATAPPDPINPTHYKRGPLVRGVRIEAIDVTREVADFRLGNAMKYVWRVGFGGKDNNIEDIKKAVWYLNDWLEHPNE